MSVAAPAENLGSEHRAALYEVVRRWPGLHLAGLARRAGLSDGLARYHMRLLVKSGLVAELGAGGSARYFLQDTPEQVVDRRDREAVAALRRPVPLQFALLLLASEGGMAMSELAAAAGIAPATATYHVQKMQRAGLVAVQPEGRQHRITVVDSARLRSILLRNPPPQDIVQGFTELWDRLEL